MFHAKRKEVGTENEVGQPGQTKRPYAGVQSVVNAARLEAEDAMSTSSSKPGSTFNSRRSSLSDGNLTPTMQAFGADGRKEISGFQPSARPPLPPVLPAPSLYKSDRPTSSSGLEGKLLSVIDSKLQPLVDKQTAQERNIGEAMRTQQSHATQISYIEQALKANQQTQQTRIADLELVQKTAELRHQEQLESLKGDQQEQHAQLARIDGQIKEVDTKITTALLEQEEKQDQLLEQSRAKVMQGVLEITDNQSQRISETNKSIEGLRTSITTTEQTLLSELSAAGAVLEKRIDSGVKDAKQDMEVRIEQVSGSLGQKIDSNTQEIASFKLEVNSKIEAVTVEAKAQWQNAAEQLWESFSDKMQELQLRLQEASVRLERNEADHKQTRHFILDALVGLKAQLVANTVELTAFKDAYSEHDKQGLEYYLKEKMYAGLKNIVGQILPSFVETVEELRVTAEANLSINRNAADSEVAAILHDSEARCYADADKDEDEYSQQGGAASDQYEESGSEEGDFTPQEPIAVETMGSSAD